MTSMPRKPSVSDLRQQSTCGRSSCSCRRERGPKHCPSHNDRTPSLSITNGRDGRVLMYCHSGCDFASIAIAFGVRQQDLFAEKLPSKATSKW